MNRKWTIMPEHTDNLLSVGKLSEGTVTDFFQNFSGHVFLMDLNGLFLDADGFFKETFTAISGEDHKNDVNDIVHPLRFTDDVKRKQMAEEALRNGIAISHEFVHDNISRTCTVYPFRSFGNTAPYFLVAVHDAASKKSWELHDKNVLTVVKQLCDTIPVSILVVDPHMRLVSCNKFYRDAVNGLAVDESFALNPLKQIHPDDKYDLLHNKLPNVILNDIEETAELRVLNQNNKPYKWATLRAKKTIIENKPFVIMVVSEITELKETKKTQKQLEEQLLEYQKYELIGQLAGGIAHDFNNALSAIIGNTEIVLNNLDQSCSFIDNIYNINKIAFRSAQLTQQLLAFARKQMRLPKVLDLNEAISEGLTFYRRLIGENIQFEWHPCKHPAFLFIDPVQLEQILSNLFINARDAIGNYGTILIECELTHVESTNQTSSRSDLSPGDYIKLSISDTGCGIDTKVLPHIYEPFFTTKERENRTGLGLSTVYGIVRQNDGHIECKTKLGNGTRFDIYLPRHKDSERDKESEEKKQFTIDAMQTILVIEDEPYILKTIRDILEIRQFRVITAKNEKEALLLAEKCTGRIDLIITDILLPTMNGVELSSLLQRNNPKLKTLFMTAHTLEDITLEKQFGKGVDFIAKPFSINQFTQAINRVLSTL
ncbi:MAG TPA: response regulator [Chlorobaculum sp.]|nr:response regulator [Chlorobaculum sp.]